MTDQIIREALGDVIQVREKLAEVGTDVKHLAHDVKNMLQALSNFVPRNEIMAMQQASLERASAIHERITALAKTTDERMEKVEEAQTWITRKVIFWSAGSASGSGALVFGVMKAFGH